MTILFKEKFLKYSMCDKVIMKTVSGDVNGNGNGYEL